MPALPRERLRSVLHSSSPRSRVLRPAYVAGGFMGSHQATQLPIGTMMTEETAATSARGMPSVTFGWGGEEGGAGTNATQTQTSDCPVQPSLKSWRRLRRKGERHLSLRPLPTVDLSDSTAQFCSSRRAIPLTKACRLLWVGARVFLTMLLGLRE